MSGDEVPLFEALGVRAGDVVSVVGAGGKTHLLYALAEQARERGLGVLVTTTTHMGALPERTTGPLLVEAEGAGDAELDEALAREGRVTLLGRRVRPDKLEGLAPERVDALVPRADLLLVEADGARGRSLKLPGDHEPVLPASTTLLVVVAALDVLGAPLGAERVHRLERVLEAAGRPEGSSVDAEVLRRVLTAPRGYAAHRPAGGRAVVFLNKADGPGALAAAREVGARLAPPWPRVVAGAARDGLGRVVADAPGALLS